MLAVFLTGLIILCHLSNAVASTIYQWSDPWGQIQYSETPVPGAMISDLKELPEMQETTEQQKQAAMVRKLQEMRQDNLQRKQITAARQHSKTQALEKKNHCIKLRNLLTEIQLTNLRQSSVFGPLFFHGHYRYLEYELLKEIQDKCR